MIRSTSPDDLPRPQPPKSREPSANPEFVPSLARAWFDEEATKGFDLARAIPSAGPYRASFASKRCDRDLWYSMNDTPESNPPGISAHWGFYMGHRVHDAFQSAINKIHPFSRSEVDVDLNTIGIAGSAHADLITYDPCPACDGRRTRPDVKPEDIHDACWTCMGSGLGAPDAVIELKSTNATGFATMCTRDRGPAEGPRSGHVLQAALVAAAIGARRVIVIYVALENFSAWRHAKYAFDQSETGKFTAEFPAPMIELIDVVGYEIARIERVAQVTVRPAREIHDSELPPGATITDPNPPTGNAPWMVREGDDVVAMGTWWGCSYCNHRDTCIADGA